MIKGKEQQQTKRREKYEGFTTVSVRAVNPTRVQIDKLLKRETIEDGMDPEYLSQDQDGNQKVSINFWLYSEELDHYFIHSIWLTNKVKESKDGLKKQYVNSTCSTFYVDDPANLPTNFTMFLSKTKDELGYKRFREALVGEQEMCVLLTSWLGRIKWTDPETDVLLEVNELFKGNYKELQDLVDGNYDTPFVALTGVKTKDTGEQYQTIFNKMFLPASFMNYISKGKVFPTDYTKKMWDKFNKEVSGEYGFNAYYSLDPAKAYDQSKDLAASVVTKVDEVKPTNSKF
jgi:hypothetical protein